MKDLPDMTIMVVDDDAETLFLTKDILHREGFQNIVTVTSGKKAIKALNEVKVDLILLDIEMPDMNGYEACRAIKSQAGLGDIPIMFFSGKYDKQTLLECFRAGGFAFMAKPFTASEMTKKIKTYLTLNYDCIVFQGA
jgi:two-component system, NtrC family, sensor kinase